MLILFSSVAIGWMVMILLEHLREEKYIPLVLDIIVIILLILPIWRS